MSGVEHDFNSCGLTGPYTSVGFIGAFHRPEPSIHLSTKPVQPIGWLGNTPSFCPSHIWGAPYFMESIIEPPDFPSSEVRCANLPKGASNKRETTVAVCMANDLAEKHQMWYARRWLSNAVGYRRKCPVMQVLIPQLVEQATRAL
jgi:hypothetical protein